MAVKRVNRNFIGLSTDTKPSQRVRQMTMWQEIDTGKLYIYVQTNVDGTKEWKEVTFV